MAKKTQALTRWDEKLAAEAQMATAAVASIGTGGNWISTRNGRLSYKSGEVPENKMSVIVIDYILENGWYSQPFDPDNPASPDCYAFGRDTRQMKPHEKASNPQGDANGMCIGCEKNQYGSADRGKGKACANRIRLAMITEGDMEDIENAEVAYMKVPPTSQKAWAGYVNQIAGVLKKPPCAVVTEISVVPHPKTQFQVQFKLVQAIEDGAALEALFAKKEQVEREIDFPYQEIVPVEAVAPAPVQRRGQKVTVKAKPAVRVGAAKAAKY